MAVEITVDLLVLIGDDRAKPIVIGNTHPAAAALGFRDVSVSADLALSAVAHLGFAARVGFGVKLLARPEGAGETLMHNAAVQPIRRFAEAANDAERAQRAGLCASVAH